MNNEIAPISQQIAKLRTELEERRENIFAASAAHIRPERFIEQVARACIRNPKLIECSRPSLFMAAAQAASLGLEIDGVLGHAYMIPFKGQATLVPGYLGLKELAYRSGLIASIETGRVKIDDEFEWEKGTSQYLKHKPSDSPVDSGVTHVYAIVRTTTHGTIFDVMSWPQIEYHRNKFSKNWRKEDSAWQTSPVAMAEKTVLRKVLKLCPLSAELQRLMQQEELTEHVEGFTSGAEAPPEDLDAAARMIEGATPVEPVGIYGHSDDGSLSPQEELQMARQQGIPF